MLTELYGGNNMKKKILILTNYYFPGVKGGGPIQSIVNMVDHLSDKFEFFILTSDRDFGDAEKYSNIKEEEWIPVGNAKVLYIAVTKISLRKLTDIINGINCDVVYLNSFFSYKFSISALLLSKLKYIHSKELIIAPRGEFSPGALSLKKMKKQLFIKVARNLRLYENVKWHATTDMEKKDIENVFGNNRLIKVASNLTVNYDEIKYDKDIEKQKGKLKVIFLSRIHPSKNLKKAIESLQGVNGQIEFNIYGPLEDMSYWHDCQKTIQDLPKTIKVTYHGIVGRDKILTVFKSNHIFLFPTLGENFGHVISEALIGGCPIVISDQTPWKELKEINVGWDISLNSPNGFKEALQYYTNLDKREYDILSRNAFNFGRKVSNRSEDIRNNIELFN